MSIEVKDFLKELVTVTGGLDLGVLVVTASKKEVLVESVMTDKSLIVKSKLKPVKGLTGKFGITDRELLTGLIFSKVYSGDDTKINVNTIENSEGEKVPEEFVFKGNASSSHFRLVGEKACPPQPKFSGTKVDILIEDPDRNKVDEFSSLTSLFKSVEDKFTPSTNGKNLVFSLGEEGVASHRTSIVFAEGVDGKFTSGYSWRYDDVLTVLKLGNTNKCSMKFDNDGMLEIELTTGVGTYNFYFPGFE